jgi:hypothetical protein
MSWEDLIAENFDECDRWEITQCVHSFLAWLDDLCYPITP